MAKNIVVCCDGTGNEYGDCNSDVMKLYRMVIRDDTQQIGYYNPGLGTLSTVPALTKVKRGRTAFALRADRWRVFGIQPRRSAAIS